ncbi:hypothetical protein OIDMADRAFT_29079 [Oidiodendron maius Zn]|uniref:Uncharacterized protein n=1 Tax=Oidiodendron maius (strain Zn) TaxID=913774 RepID=A0A0C3CQW8_OIDMZ|nr:hypothetical protein OIDMADRAFT_29079 [Oidiodendron maius Zn]
MGLIKTAILTGGGIYAINKLSKAAEARHNNPPPSNYPPQNFNPNYPPQGYWGPPPQGQSPYGQHQRDPDGYYNNQPQGRWGPPPNGPQPDQKAYGDDKYPPAEGSYDSRALSNNPPAYYNQSQGYNNNPPQGQSYDQKGSAGSGSMSQ